jgi:hypothetical protein
MSTDDPTTWKRCATCKKPIAFVAPYFACSVSTCNRKGTDFAFCTVDCWDAHVPVYRHRDSWADEKTAPTAEQWAREQRAETVRAATSSAGAAPHGAAPAQANARDVLVVVSKLKGYVKDTAGMNTSDDVVDVLSDRLRLLCDDAIERARADGRKTVMARDFRRPTAN